MMEELITRVLIHVPRVEKPDIVLGISWAVIVNTQALLEVSKFFEEEPSEGPQITVDVVVYKKSFGPFDLVSNRELVELLAQFEHVNVLLETSHEMGPPYVCSLE